MGSSGPAPFPSSRTVRTKRDYQIPSIENQEAIAQTLSKWHPRLSDNDGFSPVPIRFSIFSSAPALCNYSA